MSGLISGIYSRAASLTKWMLTPPSQPDMQMGRFDEFGRWESRVQRYDVWWAFYSNTAYFSAHLWTGQFKTMFGLYRHTRGTYNPMYRLGEFWGTVIWGGKLNSQKLGGRIIQSAIPIVTDDDRIRDALTKLWKDSQWDTQKDMVARISAIKGDVGIKVAYDAATRKVMLQPVDPSTIRWISLDLSDGRKVLAYELQEHRFDPRYDLKSIDPRSPGSGQQSVLYIERATLEGDRVHYQTSLNYEPFAWNGVSADWYEDYPFIPFVLHAHILNIPNYYWGWSEFQAAMPKSIEVDDLGSKHHDQIRKASEPKWFMAGVNKPTSGAELKMQGANPSECEPMPDRQELPFLYGSIGATAFPMVFNLDNQFVSVETMNQLAALEDDYPELRYMKTRVSGDASGKAWRESRKAAEVKVHSRRAGADADLAKIQAMALAIGGMIGAPGYEGFGIQQYLDGVCDHTIGERSVFLVDPIDRIEEETALYAAWKVAHDAGIPDEVIMVRMDFSPEEITQFHDAKKKEQDQAAQVAVDTAKAVAAAVPPQPAASGPAASNGKSATKSGISSDGG